MVERARLEIVYTPKGYRGFESLLLRHVAADGMPSAAVFSVCAPAARKGRHPWVLGDGLFLSALARLRCCFAKPHEHGGDLGSRGLALGGEGALAGAAHDPRTAGPLHGGNRVLAQIREAGESGGRGDMAGACVDRTHLGPQRRGPTSGLKSVPATRPNPPPRQKKLTPFRFRPEAENSISVPSFFLIHRKPALLGFPAVPLLGGNPPVSPLRSETAPFAQGRQASGGPISLCGQRNGGKKAARGVPARKNAVTALRAVPTFLCRAPWTRVRRRALHSVSCRRPKTPYPLPPSSFSAGNPLR